MEKEKRTEEAIQVFRKILVELRYNYNIDY